MLQRKNWMGMSVLCSAGLLLSAPVAAQDEDEWTYALSPLFLWGLSLEGESTINGATAPLDLDFKDDILENLEMVFTVHFEARRDALVLFTEYQYVDLDPDAFVLEGPLEFAADVTFKESMLELGAGWIFAGDESTWIEIIGGARYTDQEINVDLSLNPPPPELMLGDMRSGGDDWWHGFLGLRVVHSLSDNWTFVARADGGYGGSDNSAFNGSFQFDWRFNDWGSVFFGGRYLSYDYESSDFALDATKAGPLAGLTIHW